MKPDSIAIANFFIDKSKEESSFLGLLKLVKLVYIGYGFCLAVLGKNILNPKYDKVEAWKYGPVIPNVYHSFKHYGRENIKDRCKVLKGFDENNDLNFVDPKIEDEDVKNILEIVWKIYGKLSGSSLIRILHAEGTPWWECYDETCNNEIPDSLTSNYYKKIALDIQNGKLPR